MKKNFIIFAIALLYGFSVLYFRVAYEENTGKSKSHWNVVSLQEGDSKNFFDRGLSISEGRHYFSGCENAPIVAFFRPPVYPFFLAFTFLIFGVSIKAVIILQLIIASLIVVMVSATAELLFDKIIGLISGVLAILYYPMWNTAVIINSELLSTLLGLTALYFMLRLYKSGKIQVKLLFLSGIFAGLASLTRGQFFYYSVALLIFIFAANNERRIIKFRYGLVFYSFCLIPILIWALYAYVSAGLFVFISSQGALAIWWGWSPIVVLEEQYPVWNNLWDASFINKDMIGTYLPVKTSAWFLSEAINFIFKYPADSLKIAYFKLLDSWGFIDLYSSNSAVSKIIKVIKLNWDFFIAVPGWILLWRKKENMTFLKYVLISALIFTLLGIMTAGLIRYRIPFLDPLFIILASAAVHKIYLRYKIKKIKV